jgi:hypothetical protein
MIRNIWEVAEKNGASIDYNFTNNGNLVAPCVGVISDNPNNIFFAFVDNKWRKPCMKEMEDGQYVVFWPGIYYTEKRLEQIKNNSELEPALPIYIQEEEEQEVRTTVKKRKVPRPRKSKEEKTTAAPKTKRTPKPKNGEMTDKQKVVVAIIEKNGPINVDGMIEQDASFTKKGITGVVASLSRKGVIEKTEQGWKMKG